MGSYFMHKLDFVLAGFVVFLNWTKNVTMLLLHCKLKKHEKQTNKINITKIIIKNKMMQCDQHVDIL